MIAGANSARPTELILGYTTPLIARPGGESGPGQLVDRALQRVVGSSPLCGPTRQRPARADPRPRTAGLSTPQTGDSDRRLIRRRRTLGDLPRAELVHRLDLDSSDAADGDPASCARDPLPRRLRGLVGGPRSRARASASESQPVRGWSRRTPRRRRRSHPGPISWSASTPAPPGVRLSRTGASGRSHTVERDLALGGHQGGDTISIGAPHRQDRPVRAEGNGCFNGKLGSPTIYAGALNPERTEEARAGRQSIRRRRSSATSTSPTRSMARAWRTAPRSATRRWSSTQPTPGSPDRAGAARPPRSSRTPGTTRRSTSTTTTSRTRAGRRRRPSTSRRTPSRASTPRGSSRADCEDVPFIVTTPTARRREGSPCSSPRSPTSPTAASTRSSPTRFSYRSFTGREHTEAPLGWRDCLAVDLGLSRSTTSTATARARSTRPPTRPLLNLRPDYVWPLLEGPHGLALDLRLIAWLEPRAFALRPPHRPRPPRARPRGARPLRDRPHRRATPSTGPPPCSTPSRATWTRAAGWSTSAATASTGSPGSIPSARTSCELRAPAARQPALDVRAGRALAATTSEAGRPVASPGTAAAAPSPASEPRRLGGGPANPLLGARPASRDHDMGLRRGRRGHLGERGILGGAAGYEIDRTDPALGTPQRTEALATSTAFHRALLPGHRGLHRHRAGGRRPRAGQRLPVHPAVGPRPPAAARRGRGGGDDHRRGGEADLGERAGVPRPAAMTKAKGLRWA